MALKDIVKFIPWIGEPAMAKWNTDQTILANKNMAEYQFSKDKEMWNMQNAYNTPGSQMQRFKDAGLNPNLIYGQGSAGNATQLPKYQAPGVSYDYKALKTLPVLGMFQELARKQAQIDNIKAQTEYTNSKNVNEGLMTALKNLLINKENVNLRYLDDYLSQRNMNQWRSGQLQMAQGQIMKYSAEYRKKQIDAFDRVTNSHINNLKAQIDRTKVDTALRTKELEMYNLGVMTKVAPGLTNLIKMILLKK